ncbi:MAG: transporter substrate-binding domain-containing protein [Gammaproteobacteria bacterium]
MRCVLVGLLALAAVSVEAAQPVPRVLRIGTSGDYAPFSVRDGSGLHGFDIELANAFAAARGYAIEWVPFAWPDLAADFAAGRFDLVMSGVTVRPDRSIAGRFSVPVARSGAVLLYDVRVHPDAVDVDDFDRAGVRLAVNRGGHLERVTRARFARAEVHALADNAAVRSQLVDGAVDAVVTDTLEAPGWRRGLAHVGEAGPWTTDRKAYWLAPGQEALAAELDTWLLAREADGTLARLRRDAIGDAAQAPSATPLAALVAAIDERLGLMPLVAAAKRRDGLEVEDRARETAVIDAAWRAVRATTGESGARPDEAAVRHFYAVQIEAAKFVQARELARADTTTGAPDLQQALRPALLRIGQRMAALVVAVHRAGVPPDLESHLADDLRPWGLPAELLTRLAAATRALAPVADREQ